MTLNITWWLQIITLKNISWLNVDGTVNDDYDFSLQIMTLKENITLTGVVTKKWCENISWSDFVPKGDFNYDWSLQIMTLKQIITLLF